MMAFPKRQLLKQKFLILGGRKARVDHLDSGFAGDDGLAGISLQEIAHPIKRLDHSRFV